MPMCADGEEEEMKCDEAPGLVAHGGQEEEEPRFDEDVFEKETGTLVRLQREVDALFREALSWRRSITAVKNRSQEVLHLEKMFSFLVRMEDKAEAQKVSQLIVKNFSTSGFVV